MNAINWFNSLSRQPRNSCYSASIKVVGRFRGGDGDGGLFGAGGAEDRGVYPGPRTGPIASGRFGILQPVADGVKSFLKEDFTPGHVRKVYFWLAPMIAMIPALLVLAVIPFGSQTGRRRKWSSRT